MTTIPTIGFNVESVTYKNLNFNVWDLGGQTSIRPYWRCYYANTAAVIFVVDSTDIERLQTAADELAAMLNEEELKDAALLVFANKQDQPGAKGAGDISQALRLGELRDRNWSIMACSAVEGSGVTEGMDWLVVRLWPCPTSRSARMPFREQVLTKGHSKRYHRSKGDLHLDFLRQGVSVHLLRARHAWVQLGKRSASSAFVWAFSTPWTTYHANGAELHHQRRRDQRSGRIYFYTL